MTIVALFIGGAIGGFLRYFLATVIPGVNGFPDATLLINLSGSLILGAFYGVAAVREVPTWLRMGFGVGVIGAYTTFSTFCLDTDTLFRHSLMEGYLYIAASMILGPILAYVGDLLVAAVSTRIWHTAEEVGQ